MTTITLRSKSLMCTNVVNSTLCYATGPFWGFLFDWIIFANRPNKYTFLGALFVGWSSYINLSEEDKK